MVAVVVEGVPPFVAAGAATEIAVEQPAVAPELLAVVAEPAAAAAAASGLTAAAVEIGFCWWVTSSS